MGFPINYLINVFFISCFLYPDWLQTHYVAMSDLKVLILQDDIELGILFSPFTFQVLGKYAFNYFSESFDNVERWLVTSIL